MATVTVEVDLDEFSDNEIIQEIEYRAKNPRFLDKLKAAKKEIRESLVDEMTIDEFVLEASKMMKLSIIQHSKLVEFLKDLKY